MFVSCIKFLSAYDSQRVIDKRWSQLELWPFRPRFFSSAFDQELKPIFVASLFEEVVLKFLEAKQNPLSSFVLYSNHENLEYQRA